MHSPILFKHAPLQHGVLLSKIGICLSSKWQPNSSLDLACKPLAILVDIIAHENLHYLRILELGVGTGRASLPTLGRASNKTPPRLPFRMTTLGCGLVNDRSKHGNLLSNTPTFGVSLEQVIFKHGRQDISALGQYFRNISP